MCVNERQTGKVKMQGDVVKVEVSLNAMQSSIYSTKKKVKKRV